MAIFFPDTSVLMSAIFYPNEGDLFTKASRDFLSDQSLTEKDEIKILDSIYDEFDKLIERLRKRLKDIVKDSFELIKKMPSSLHRELAGLIKRHLKEAVPGDRRFIWIVGHRIFTLLEQCPKEFGRKLFELADSTESEVLFRSKEFKGKLATVRIEPGKDAYEVIKGIENKQLKRDKEHLARVVQFAMEKQGQAVFLTNDLGLLTAYENKVKKKTFEIALPYMYVAFKERK